MKNFDRTAVRLILSFGLAWICAGCESRLEAALELAGENRPELEAVLQHYSGDKADSLKYRAARFLIENLPLHYGYAGKGLEDFKCDFDSLFCDKDIPRQVLRGRAENYNPDLTGVHPAFDLSELGREFLIRHIDNAFATLDYPWTKGLSFGDFCEYILPYRVENELAEDWMPHYRDFLAEIIRPLQQAGADRYTAARTIQDSLRRMDYEVIDESVMRVALRPSDYLRAAGGACPEITSLMWYALRSVGLPVNYDYILQCALLLRNERPGIRQAFRIPAAGACREGLPQDVQFPAPEPAQPKGSPGGGNSAGLPIPLHKGRFGIVFRRHRPCPETDDPDRGQKEIRLPGRFRQPELGACRLEPDKARAGGVRSCRKGLRLYGHVL